MFIALHADNKAMFAPGIEPVIPTAIVSPPSIPALINSSTINAAKLLLRVVCLDSKSPDPVLMGLSSLKINPVVLGSISFYIVCPLALISFFSTFLASFMILADSSLYS